MRKPTVIAGGSDSQEGRGILALVESEEDDDLVLAMFSADFNHEDEEPPFSIVVTNEELFQAGSKMIRLANDRLKKSQRSAEVEANAPG